MNNKFEIEKKYYIKGVDIDDLVGIIKKSGAKYEGQSRQVDTYFNVPNRNSLISKECLRIRESEEKKEITYKPPTKKSDLNNDFFAKQEVNLRIDNTKTAKILLQNIGCDMLVKVKKERKRFRLDKFKIFIDNIKNVGLFLEIEIMDSFDNIQKGVDAINKLMDNFGIQDYLIEDKPYRDLVIEKEKGGNL